MTTVLFACVHNAGRSQIAEALFNRHADPRKAKAISAGTHPAAHVHPEVVSLMRGFDVDLSTRVPRRLTAELASGAQWLVTMGCGDECPVVPGVGRADWPVPDPTGQSPHLVARIVSDIDARIRSFIAANGWGL